MQITIKSRSDGRQGTGVTRVPLLPPLRGSRVICTVFLGLASQAITYRHFATNKMWVTTRHDARPTKIDARAFRSAKATMDVVCSIVKRAATPKISSWWSG